MADKDPTETTINIDYDTKSYLCWTNHKPTINQWVKDFPDYTKVAKDGYSATANTIPFTATKKIKLYKPKNMSEEQRELLRQRMFNLNTKTPK